MRQHKKPGLVFESTAHSVQVALLDQIHFNLDTDKLKQFTDLLDTPPSQNPGLERLMGVSAPWCASSSLKQ
jgi:uncharacterized protein (DUF1778 family)